MSEQPMTTVRDAWPWLAVSCAGVTASSLAERGQLNTQPGNLAVLTLAGVLVLAGIIGWFRNHRALGESATHTAIAVGYLLIIILTVAGATNSTSRLFMVALTLAVILDRRSRRQRQQPTDDE